MRLHLSVIALGALYLLSCAKGGGAASSSGLDNLRGRDTLILRGHFADCGEWGGHHEVIRIYRQDNVLHATYERDTVKCPDPSYFNRRIVESLEGQLDPSKEKRVVAYLQGLTERTFLDEGISHAGDVYVATREDMGFELVYRNYSQNWNGFAELKRSLFSAQ